MTTELIEMEVPEGCVVTVVVAVAELIDSEGRLMYTTVHQGDTTISSAIGLLELGKRDLIALSDEFNERG